MDFNKITEQDSNYDHLERMNISELIKNINEEDKSVPLAVEKAIPQIEILIKQVISKLNSGGRLFYIGAGTSGRLGILDASECPPTFGVPHELVIGLIAGYKISQLFLCLISMSSKNLSLTHLLTKKI